MASSRYQIGIDIGGTFTDVVAADEAGTLRILKIPSSRGSEDVAVRAAIGQLADQHGVAPAAIARFVHGTTVATNAVLERKGARVGLLTTAGFRDVLEIGRQSRGDLYDLRFKPSSPDFLVPHSARLEVTERIGPDGRVVTSLDMVQLRSAIGALLEQGVEAIAVCYLFSFLNDAHERATATAISEMAPGLAVSLSCEVDPGFREYERTCATAFDAYVKPKLRSYLEGIAHHLEGARVAASPQVIQSRGGVSAFDTALRRPGRLFLSGPAAGVIGGQMVGRSLGLDDLITIDIGGTSSDIALIAGGRPAIRDEGLVDGYPVRVPMVDVNAIGAGGGSIAWIDAGGGLRVGPHSAGSVPGPACYGLGGTDATVTDASVVLGYLDPAFFAGGTVALDRALARAAILEKVAGPLGMGLEEAARGIHRVVNAQMAEGIRLVSVKRGTDPRGFVLVPLGGGGGLHATALAEELDIATIAVPLHPGVLSAIGLLAAPVEHEVAAGFYRTVVETEVAELESAFAELDRRCGALMAAERDAGSPIVSHFADMCYVGQSYNLEIPVEELDPGTPQRLYDAFLTAHERVYGHSTRNPARIVNLRSVHRAAPVVGLGQADYTAAARSALKGRRSIVLPDGAWVETGIWDRMALPPGQIIAGPAVIEQNDTTTLLVARWQAVVQPCGSLILTRGAAS